jgi:hypothetical protein
MEMRNQVNKNGNQFLRSPNNVHLRCAQSLAHVWRLRDGRVYGHSWCQESEGTPNDS